MSSFRFRKEKGAETVTYKADDCKQVVYDGLNIISLPKNLKKPDGKRRFYVAIYYGKKFSVLQDPKVSSAAGGGGAIVRDQFFYTEWTEDRGNAWERVLFDHPQDPLELHNSSEKKNISKSWRDGLPHFTKTGVKVLSLLTDSFPGNC